MLLIVFISVTSLWVFEEAFEPLHVDTLVFNAQTLLFFLVFLEQIVFENVENHLEKWHGSIIWTFSVKLIVVRNNDSDEHVQ